MREIKAPGRIPEKGPFLFLAGSIEMGAAENWQERVARELDSTRLTLLNPRRDDWDASWTQSKDNPQFFEQVSWELEAQERADIILMYFAPGTKSPISLLELGLFARSHKMTVVCPDGFWRKGNVEIVCDRYGVPCQPSLEKAIHAIRVLYALPTEQPLVR